MNGAAATQPAAFSVAALARGGILSLVGAVVSALSGFLVTFAVSRYLGPEGAGVFAVLVAGYMILLVSGKLGADTALVHVVPRLVEEGRPGAVRPAVRAALLPVICVNTVIAAALVLAAPEVVGFLLPSVDPAVAVPALIICAIALPVGGATLILLAATRGVGRIVALVGVENILKPLLRLLLVLAALALGRGVTAAVLAWAVPTVVGLGIAVAAYLRYIPHSDRSEDRRAAWGPVWEFARPRAVAAVLEILGLQLGVILLGALSTPAAAGVYSAAARVVMVGVVLQQSLRLVVAPQMSRLMHLGQVESLTRLHRESAVWIVMLCWPLYVLILAWPAQLMSIFGPGFESGAAALSILCLGALVNLFTGNIQTVVLMSGRAEANLVITVVSVALNAALCVLLIPQFGTAGAAVGRTVAVTWENVAAMVFAKRVLGVRTVSGPLVVAASLAATAFFAPALLLRSSGDPSQGQILIQVLISSLLYLVALVVLRKSLLLDKLLAVVRSALKRRAPTQSGGR